MEGVGLFAFADLCIYEEDISLDKNFRINYYYSKQHFDLEKRYKKINSNKNNIKINCNRDKDKEKIQDDSYKEFIKKFLDNDINYYLYLGEFKENKFHGIGEIYHNVYKKFEGKFNSNKIVEKKFT
jgi:hypothetical protein